MGDQTLNHEVKRSSTASVQGCGSVFLKRDVQFVLLATVALLVFGWFARTGLLAVNTDLSLMPMSREATRFFRLWMRAAIVLGVLVPVVMFLASAARSDVRKAIGPYLSVLVIQIVTELLLIRVLFTSIAVPIGTVYTSFRLWQLWEAMKIIKTSDQLGTTSRRVITTSLWLLLGFWTVNLTFVLFLMQWPRLFATK